MDTGGAARATVLEVAVAHERDVPGAAEGGADRLRLATPGGRSPEPALVSAVCRESSLPVLVDLRLTDSWTTTGAELARLVGLAADYAACGAAGYTVGFLDADLEVDVAVCTSLAEQLPDGLPWVFSEAFDATLDPRRSWRRVLGLPGLAGVRSAGSPQGMAVGYDDLLAVAADPAVARLVVAGGGLQAEQVPWLLRAGVRQLAVDTQVRPGASARSYVEAGHVRSWRRLLD
ncbi:copper homeostasis protein CutC [Nocardioides abyssi]|uniref:Copper homeostasis protein cutC homolog n=1 Tax=Nocardioides abyssi TaxID=3058370 RepID=A0ABT8EWU5_9ACTN|nr:copper homeostasis protein CutC [Nocardioides abyssi]MDN4162608.1 copper homeostasis protein CutC [Nocardioides abyssi]